MLNGPGRAHRATRDIEPATPPVASAAGPSWSPVDRMRSDREQWKELWKASHVPAARQAAAGTEVVWARAHRRASVGAIRSAAMMLTTSASAACGIPPRLMTVIIEADMEPLVLSLQASEATGDFPGGLFGPKRRPFGLYRAVYRCGR